MCVKKVLFYISTLSGGGAAKVMVNIANMLAEYDYIITFVTNFSSDREYLLNDNIKRISIDRKKENIIKKNSIRIIELRKLLSADKYDVCISFMEENNFRLLIATLGIKIRKIISVRSCLDRPDISMITKIIAKNLYKLSDGIVFQTEEAKEWFSNDIQKKSIILPNMLEERFYNCSYCGDDGHIVTLSRLIPVKNIELLIKAFAEILKNNPTEILDIYGDGELKDELKKLTVKLNIEDKVHFKGITNNVQDVLAKAKVFVLTSDYEGVPNALMEAMAVGVPCIATDCKGGGARTLIHSGVDGLLVKVNDVNGLAASLDELINNKNKAEFLGKNAKEHAKDFLPKIVFQKWKEYVDKNIEIRRSFV